MTVSVKLFNSTQIDNFCYWVKYFPNITVINADYSKSLVNLSIPDTLENLIRGRPEVVDMIRM